MMDAAAANCEADATFAQLMTWWPWASFKHESLETAFQATPCSPLFVMRCCALNLTLTHVQAQQTKNRVCFTIIMTLVLLLV